MAIVTLQSVPRLLPVTCHVLACANVFAILLWLSGTVDPMQRTFFFTGRVTKTISVDPHENTHQDEMDVRTRGKRVILQSEFVAVALERQPQEAEALPAAVVPTQLQQRALTERESAVTKYGVKVVVWWNKKGRGGENEAKHMCEPYSCVIRTDREKVADADAVVVEFPFIDTAALARDIPQNRPPRQAWVFYNREPPTRLPLDLSPVSDAFNLTWTYRGDSDIYYPYAVMEKKQVVLKPKATPDVNHATGKTKMAAWMVSNCKGYVKSRRMEFAKELHKHVQVDIYGKCGTLSCGDRRNKTGCYEMIERDYKFYLSFENALCKDYMTEKFWRYREAKVVPVVLSAFNVSRLPPKVAIDVSQFKSVRYLAKYLKRLDQNDTLYNEYFTWERGYKIKGTGGVCKLCKFLHENPDYQRVYNISEWWSEEKNCMSAADYFKRYEDEVLTA